MKDVICSPRPVPPVKRKVKGHGVEEYGMPSTHSLNGICMASYILHFYWTHDFLTSNQFMICLIVLIVWMISVCVGRLYLGMHSPWDVYVGIFMGLSLLLWWCLVDQYVDAWVVSGSGVIPLQLVMSLLLIGCYPVPIEQNPAKVYAVYFAGVSLGVITGCHRTYDLFHSPEASAKVHEFINFQSLAGVGYGAVRFVVGMLVVLVFKISLDWICRVGVPPVLDALSIPWTEEQTKATAPTKKKTDSLDDIDDEPTPTKGKRSSKRGEETPTTVASPSSTSSSECTSCEIRWKFNVTTWRRFWSYFAVGWAVVEPCMYLFRALDM